MRVEESQYDESALLNPKLKIDVAADFEPKRVIVFPVNRHSEEAVKWSIRNLINYKEDQVILMNVRPHERQAPPLPMPLISLASTKNLNSDREKESCKLLTGLANNFQAANIHTRAIALVGDRRDALETTINNLKPTLVVIRARGLGPVKRFFGRSTSHHLLQHLKVPVLVLPPVLSHSI